MRDDGSQEPCGAGGQEVTPGSGAGTRRLDCPPGGADESAPTQNRTPAAAHHPHGNEVHDRACTFNASGARTGDTPNMIARIEYPYGDAEAQAATAHLFAAAPLLLDALRYIVGWAPEGWSAETARDMALAAIALAEGTAAGT